MGSRIYIGTVALERNRWASRQPSFLVSGWLDRFRADGFDGIELWENHYLCADPDEQRRLRAAAPIAVYNSYAGFDEGSSDTRARTAEAVARLKAGRVKYNFGNKADKTAEYRQNLLSWADDLPEECVLLCECHGGTVLETVDSCEEVFSGLDPVKFGMIVHLSGTAEGAEPWFRSFGKRIQHVHVQLRSPESDPAREPGRESLRQGIASLRRYGFDGDWSMEFSRGIGKEEDIELIYANVCSDMREIRKILKREEARD